MMLFKLRYGDKFKNGGGIFSNNRYMINLHCLVAQATFFSDEVESWLSFRRLGFEPGQWHW